MVYHLLILRKNIIKQINKIKTDYNIVNEKYKEKNNKTKK
jgi:hypothetical protein